jgi:hypothetical protein
MYVAVIMIVNYKLNNRLNGAFHKRKASAYMSAPAINKTENLL